MASKLLVITVSIMVRDIDDFVINHNEVLRLMTDVDVPHHECDFQLRCLSQLNEEDVVTQQHRLVIDHPLFSLIHQRQIDVTYLITGNLFVPESLQQLHVVDTDVVENGETFIRLVLKIESGDHLQTQVHSEWFSVHEIFRHRDSVIDDTSDTGGLKIGQDLSFRLQYSACDIDYI